jgi:membrane protease YdiL (CAAX protease family)
MFAVKAIDDGALERFADGALRLPAPPRPDLRAIGARPAGSIAIASWSPSAALTGFLVAFGALSLLQILLFALNVHGPRLLNVCWAIGEGTVSLGIAAVAAHRLGAGSPFKAIGLRFPRVSDIVIGIVAGFLLVLATAWLQALVYRYLASWVNWYPTSDLSNVVLVSDGPWIVLGVLQVLAVAVGEESLFRGFLYRGLRTRYSITASVLLSSALFAFVHFYPPIMPAIFVDGIVLALVAEWRRSLAMPIVMHATVNGLFLIAAYPS